MSTTAQGSPAVFPEPVRAMATTSCPARISGRVFLCKNSNVAVRRFTEKVIGMGLCIEGDV
jgi:hypothetical protein